MQDLASGTARVYSVVVFSLEDHMVIGARSTVMHCNHLTCANRSD